MISLRRWRRAGTLAALAMVGTLLGSGPASADSIFAQEWFLGRLHAEQAWGITKGAGVTVAVLDTGVEATHPDLRGQVLPGVDELPDNSSPNGWVDTDTAKNGHGTAMASLIAGTGANGSGQGMVGLAPEAKILPVHVVLGNEPSAAAYARGIEYAIAHGASVINMSGGDGFGDPAEARAVQDAIAHNVIVVAAAGNTGKDANNVTYPVGYPGVLGVGSTDRAGHPAAFSVSGSFVALAAPGDQIVVAANHAGYAKGSGTSDSTALVSAAAALVRAHFPHLTAGQVINRLLRTADHPAGGRDQHVGYGIVNPYQALTADIPPGPPGNPLLASTNNQSTASPAPTITLYTSPSVQPAAKAGRGRGVALIAGITVVVLAVIAGVIALALSLTRRARRSRPPGS